MKWWRLCCQPQGSRPRAHSAAPALFEPDVGRQASPVSLSPPPSTHPPLHSRCILVPCCFLASGAAITSHSCRSCWIDRCCTSVHPPSPAPIPPLSSRPSLSLSLWDPSIHLFTSSLPSLCFHPSLLAWPTAPFRFAQGKEPRVCCLAACPLLSFPPPLLFSYLILPSSSSFLPLIPCFALSSPLFLVLATFSSYLPLSPSLSPPASNHSPLHLFHSLPPFILRSPSFSPSLPHPPSLISSPGWAQEQ